MTFRHLTSILFASLWTLSGSTAIASSLDFATDQLGNMAKIIGIDASNAPADDADTTIILTYKTLPVRVDINGGEVSHIGYSIFDDALRGGPNDVVFDFLERYALAADMPLKRDKSVNAMLAEDQMTFEGGDFSRLKRMKTDGYSISVNNLNGRQYRVSWNTPDEQTEYAVSFPISYDLLHGTGMVENERRLLDGLTSHINNTDNSVSVTRPELLATWKLNYYILPGNSYYTDALTTNKYYRFVISDTISAGKTADLIESVKAMAKAASRSEKTADNKPKLPKAQKQSGFELIYNPSVYPIESMANLLTTGEIDNDFILDIKHIGYDFNYQNISVPLNQAIDYFIKKNCEVFFGVSQQKGDTYTCVVIFRNIPEGYCHTMRVTIDSNDLEPRTGRFPARLTSYIPISKISSLFGENQR